MLSNFTCKKTLRDRQISESKQVFNVPLRFQRCVLIKISPEDISINGVHLESIVIH